MADTVQTWSPALQGVGRRAPARQNLRLFIAGDHDSLLICLPLIVIIAGPIVYPAFYSIYLSMLNKAQTRFIGLGNFAFLLSRDIFVMVVGQTAIFALSAVSSKP